jgi:hypothetical protein
LESDRGLFGNVICDGLWREIKVLTWWFGDRALGLYHGYVLSSSCSDLWIDNQLLSPCLGVSCTLKVIDSLPENCTANVSCFHVAALLKLIFFPLVHFFGGLQCVIPRVCWFFLECNWTIVMHWLGVVSHSATQMHHLRVAVESHLPLSLCFEQISLCLEAWMLAAQRHAKVEQTLTSQACCSLSHTTTDSFSSYVSWNAMLNQVFWLLLEMQQELRLQIFGQWFGQTINVDSSNSGSLEWKVSDCILDSCKRDGVREISGFILNSETDPTYFLHFAIKLRWWMSCGSKQ